MYYRMLSTGIENVLTMTFEIILAILTQNAG